MNKLFDWRTKKKLTFFLGSVFVIVLVVGAIVFYLWPKASCTDGRQNQDESGVDCGGPCTPCVVNPKDPITLWTRVFEIEDGLYEVAALIENPNISYGLSLLKYTFKIYDVNNILIGVKEGQTFLNPNDKFLVFETGINTKERDAVRVFVELESISDWKYIEEEKSSMVVSEKSFSRTPFPTLSARLFNQAIFSVEDIYAVAVLYDEDRNAIGASATKVDIINAESSYDISFTWPPNVDLNPYSSIVFTRIDQTK